MSHIKHFDGRHVPVLPPSRNVNLQTAGESRSTHNKHTGVPRTWLHSHFVHQIANHLDVVARNDHLLRCISGTFREGQSDGHIRSPQEELWSIALSEGSVSSSFVLGQNLDDGMSNVSNREWDCGRT